MQKELCTKNVGAGHAGYVWGIFRYAGVVTMYGVILGSFAPTILTTCVGFAMGIGRVASAMASAFAGLMFAGGFARLTVSILLPSCGLESFRFSRRKSERL